MQKLDDLQIIASSTFDSTGEKQNMSSAAEKNKMCVDCCDKTVLSQN